MQNIFSLKILIYIFLIISIVIANGVPVSIRQQCNTINACSTLPGQCVKCNFDSNCDYGSNTTVKCSALNYIKCKGNRHFVREINCRYCYQTESRHHKCVQSTACAVVDRGRYLANCTVSDSITCLGSRKFGKMLNCDWTSGKSYITALLLSITLGGFGADRFYLGYWREALGKLFSFGGLGVWTLIDVILIAVGYVSPANGSLYIQPNLHSHSRYDL